MIYSSPVQSGKGYSSPVQDGGYIVPDGGSPVPTPPPAPDASEQTRAANEATLTVNVPGEARVYVNGVQTKSIGSERSYVSRGLQPGYSYTYEVRAEVERNGQVVQETKTVNLHAGRTARVSFDLASAEAAPETTLTLHVPATAKVYLAGNETTSSGELREFKTAKLAPGQTWENYTIRVEFEQAGQIVSREKTITLTAGDSQEFSFESEANQVASVR